MRIYGYLAALSVTEKMVVGQISPSPPDILQTREFLSDSSTNVSTLRLHEFFNSRWFFLNPATRSLTRCITRRIMFPSAAHRLSHSGNRNYKNRRESVETENDCF
jgi:hypothetical protein